MEAAKGLKQILTDAELSIIPQEISEKLENYFKSTFQRKSQSSVDLKLQHVEKLEKQLESKEKMVQELKGLIQRNKKDSEVINAELLQAKVKVKLLYDQLKECQSRLKLTESQLNNRKNQSKSLIDLIARLQRVNEELIKFQETVRDNSEKIESQYKQFNRDLELAKERMVQIEEAESRTPLKHCDFQKMEEVRNQMRIAEEQYKDLQIQYNSMQASYQSGPPMSPEAQVPNVGPMNIVLLKIGTENVTALQQPQIVAVIGPQGQLCQPQQQSDKANVQEDLPQKALRESMPLDDRKMISGNISDDQIISSLVSSTIEQEQMVSEMEQSSKAKITKIEFGNVLPPKLDSAELEINLKKRGRQKTQNDACGNCGIAISRKWRKMLGKLVCEACATYYKRHGIQRPTKVFTQHQLRLRGKVQYKNEQDFVCVTCGTKESRGVWCWIGDKRACNACSVYYRKQKKERPERLWNSLGEKDKEIEIPKSMDESTEN